MLQSIPEPEGPTTPAAVSADDGHSPPEQPVWDVWSDNPFELIQVPFGALLEPDGYAAMRALKQRRTEAYATRMPRTYAVAQATFNSVAIREVWGRHVRPKKGISKKDGLGRSLLDVTWLTHTAGRWIEKNRKRIGETGHGQTCNPDKRKGGDGFPESPLVLLDVIKTLADPDHHAVGSKDVWDWRRSHLMVRNVRIDIDLNDVFDRHDLADLQGEMQIVHMAFSAFGLVPSVMRTGNRGIQAMATIPPMPRAHAGLLVHALRHALRGAPRHWKATDFQSNLDGIMRLPLGRHAWTESVSAMLAPDASVLPLEQQAKAVVSGLNGPTTMGDAWVEGVGSFLTSRRVNPWADVPVFLLAEFARERPENGLVRLLDDACVRVGAVPLGGCPRKLEPLTNTVQSDSTPTDQAAPDQAAADERAEQPAPPKRRIPTNKARAWCVLNAGFEPGASFGYYMNSTVNGIKGRNAIGMALVAFDGDVEAARTWLHEQAHRIGDPAEAVLKNRLGLIDRCLKMDQDGHPANNTYTTLQQFLSRLQATKSHRSLDGDVLPEEAALADRVVGLLVERQRGSAVKPRAFTLKALDTIRQLVGLVLMEVRQADDGIARVSFRSLASRVSGEVEVPVSAVDVSRQMEWIVSGPKCLVECFVVAHGSSRSAFSPIPYSLGRDINALLPLVPAKQE